MPLRVLLLVAACVLFAVYVLVGVSVSHAPPNALDLAGERLIGQAVPLAVILTDVGLFPTYGAVCGALLVAGYLRRSLLRKVLLSIAVLFAAWCASDFLKNVFARPRMSHWLVTHETSFSYASGHATLSLVFYGLWAYFIVRSTWPTRWKRGVVSALLVLIAGIGWSRLALGAHYVTDVLGGYLLGGALLCVVAAGERFFSAAR